MEDSRRSVITPPTSVSGAFLGDQIDIDWWWRGHWSKRSSVKSPWPISLTGFLGNPDVNGEPDAIEIRRFITIWSIIMMFTEWRIVGIKRITSIHEDNPRAPPIGQKCQGVMPGGIIKLFFLVPLSDDRFTLWDPFTSIRTTHSLVYDHGNLG